MLVRSTSTHRDWLFSHGTTSGLDLCWECLSQMLEGVGSGPQTTRGVVLLCSVLFSLNAVSVSVSVSAGAGGSATVFLANR